jgi:3-hydroxyacyl-[acyl-carrier-protein] dehydratase
MTDKMLYDIEDIKAILPHRSPFLFVDRIKEVIEGDNIVAEKDLSFDDHFFDGHFPDNPIMPGVLVSEALAQTSGLLLGLKWKERYPSFIKNKHHLFLAHVNVKFFTPARPGETLRLEASLIKTYGKFYLFEVAAYTDDNRIARGTLTLAMEI